MAATNFPIIVEQGATFYLSISYKDTNDLPVDLTGFAAAMQIRDKPGGKVAVTASTANGKITMDTVGNIAVTIPALETSRLTTILAGVYDFFLTSPGGVDPVVKLLTGDVEIVPAVTK